VCVRVCVLKRVSVRVCAYVLAQKCLLESRAANTVRERMNEKLGLSEVVEQFQVITIIIACFRGVAMRFLRYRQDIPSICSCFVGMLAGGREGEREAGKQGW
jgi:hypothetical protein